MSAWNKLHKLIIVVGCLGLGFVAASSTISIIEPEENSSFIADKDASNIRVTYDIENRSEEDVVFCVKVVSNNEVRLAETCLPSLTNNFVLQGLPAGDYLMDSYLKKASGPNFDVIGETTGTRHFTIISANEYYSPKLYLDTNDLEYVASPSEDTSDVAIAYRVEYPSGHIVPSDVLICISLVSDSVPKIDNQCLEVEREFILYNVPIGLYSLSLQLKQSSTGYMFETTKLTGFVQVRSFGESLPKIVLDQSQLEVVVKASEENGEGFLGFTLQGFARAINLVRVCARIDSASGPIMPLQALPIQSPYQGITLQGIPVGHHIVQISLCLIDMKGSPYQLDESKVTLDIDARHPVEFVPNYDWQPLRAFHTIPSSVETRLPIGGASHIKEVRIPSPWRLQVTLPNPCKYFLRMDIFRRTKMSEIRDAAAQRCNAPAECFEIVLDNSPYFHPPVNEITDLDGNSQAPLATEMEDTRRHEYLLGQMTVEQTDLFNKRHSLEYIC